MGAAYKAFWTRYFDFSGKTSRSDYWLAFLCNLIVSFVLGFLVGFLGTIGTLVSSVFALACLIPSLAIMVRRFHDIKKTAWNLLWFLVPIVGWIIVIVLLASKGK